MDLSKAFDTLDHDLLVAKLHAYGFSNNALRLIKSYLSDRWQRVKINNPYTTWSALWAYGVVISMFDFHRSDRGSNPGRGGKIS